MTLSTASVAALSEALSAECERVITNTEALCRVPAPPLREGERARLVLEQLTALGGVEASLDQAGNVVCRVAGRRGGPSLALTAHLDTVFHPEVPLVPQRTEGRLAGPGVGDNTVAVAGLVALARAVLSSGWRPATALYLVFTVGEEGEGNLAGVRAFVEEHSHELGAVIALEGNFLGRVCHTAVGSRRWQVTYRSRGGHSWEDFGTSSAVHALAAAVAKFTRTPVPESPRTTFNVGRFEGGSGVNSIAQEAVAVLDLRSVSESALAGLEERALALFQDTAHRARLTVTLEHLGTRPAGALPPDHPLVLACRAPLERRGFPTDDRPASTDANVPLALGIPAVAIGLTTGGGAHSTGEWIELAPLVQGLAALAETVAGVGAVLAAQGPATPAVQTPEAGVGRGGT